jgi:hypothetical protein
MAQVAEQIRVAASGSVYVAPLDTTVPETPATPLSAPFVELGYVTEDGVAFNNAPTVEEIRAWQKAVPVKRFVTGRDAVVTFTLQQFNPDNFALAFGGGEVTEVDPGIFQFEPPSDTDALAEWLLVVDSHDGDIDDRWVVWRGSVMDAVETSLQRTGPSLLPISFAALTPDDLDRSWRYYTTDPEFDPAGS